jgi:hypothetical protein
MQFFLYEIVARVVAAYLCYDCGRRLWRGLNERKIAYYHSNTNLLDWFLWTNRIADRDTAPIVYWITIGLHVFATLGCLGVAIVGWHANS